MLDCTLKNIIGAACTFISVVCHLQNSYHTLWIVKYFVGVMVYTLGSAGGSASILLLLVKNMYNLLSNSLIEGQVVLGYIDNSIGFVIFIFLIEFLE